MTTSSHSRIAAAALVARLLSCLGITQSTTMAQQSGTIDTEQDNGATSNDGMASKAEVSDLDHVPHRPGASDTELSAAVPTPLVNSTSESASELMTSTTPVADNGPPSHEHHATAITTIPTSVDKESGTVTASETATTSVSNSDLSSASGQAPVSF